MNKGVTGSFFPDTSNAHQILLDKKKKTHGIATKNQSTTSAN